MDASLFDKNFIVKENLSDLKRRLKIGQKLKGRIIDCPKENRYILRVWGYNIYTESEKQFNKFEDIDLKVREIEPNLVFDLKKQNLDNKNHRMNIVI